MKKWIICAAALAGLLGWAHAQTPANAASDRVYVIRFKDSAVPQLRAGSIKDDRVAQEPDAWGHIGDSVVGHIQTLERRYGVRAHAAFAHVFKGMSVRLTPAQLEQLRRDVSVDLIEAEQTYSINAAPGNGSGGTSTAVQILPWGVDKTDADLSAIWSSSSLATAGVRIYVIDTGIDMANADLNKAGLVNFVGDRKNTDCNGHGTHVAGTLAAINNGIDVVGMAPGVSVYGVKVLNCQGSGTTTSVVQGLEWVAANAIKPAVANMSLGGGISSAIDTAVKKAAAKGIFFSIAAGNDAKDACNSSPARVGGGSTQGVMTVAATDASDMEAWFSNYGDCVDIWAPGVDIPSLKVGGGIKIMSGTSMASPHVGGAAALYLGRYPTAGADSVVGTLKQMATLTGTTSKDGLAISRLNAKVQ